MQLQRKPGYMSGSISSHPESKESRKDNAAEVSPALKNHARSVQMKDDCQLLMTGDMGGSSLYPLR
jgi:hypothetical protein